MKRRYVFDTHGGDSTLNNRSGEEIEIRGRVHPSKCDEPETGPMYVVRFPDGFQALAFMDEIEIEYGF